MDLSGADRAGLLSLVEKLRRIPDRVRDFRRSTDWAARRLQLRPQLLAFLVEHGLPHRRIGGEPQFDRYDLLNCSLLLGQGTVGRAVRRYWPAALRRADTARPRYEVRFQVRCPEPGHPPPCAYRLTLPGGDEVVQEVHPGGPPPGTSVVVSPEVTWPVLPDAAKAALAETKGLEFAILGDAIRYDLDFAVASGLADCRAATLLLAEAARRRDQVARTSFGYIVAPPFAVEHHWAELRVDGVWVPVDPLLITTMVGWGVLDGPAWPPHRSIGPLVVRVAAGEVPVARHNGVTIRCTLPVRPLQ